MTIRTLIICFTVTLFATGCVVVSDNPLSPPGSHPLDKRLEGVWLHKEADGDRRYIHVMPLENGWQGAVEVRTGSPEFAYYRLFRTVLDGRDYLNVIPIVAVDSDGMANPPEDALKGRYITVLYRLTDGDNVLSLDILDTEPVEKDLEAGTVAGRASDGVLTGDSAAVANYVRANTEHFEALQTYVRVPDPS